MNKEPILSFEFAQYSGEVVPFTFRNPIKVIQAMRIEDVIPSLEKVQNAVREGYYVAGYLSYESAPAFNAKFRVADGYKMPLLWFGIYSKIENETLESDKKFDLEEWRTAISLKDYYEAIDKIKHAIKKGETYQTNFTTRLYSHFVGDDIAFFNKLKRAQNSSYCAYLNIGDYKILSASPELFFHLKDGIITTRPMKGTIKRGRTFEEDCEKAKWLLHSKKDRAENLMIVDLLRNDLGMIAETGTVHVPKMLDIESYPTVHQMTSTIQANLKNDTNLVDIFKALFPCGSITGAPKISTMKLISELEIFPREVYCGAIGYITPNNEAIFNVPIRTVTIEEVSGKATYSAGGGITWDSTVEGEYVELLNKANVLKEDRREFQLLESLLLDNGRYFLLEEHLDRLRKSAMYFDFPLDEEKWRFTLQQCASSYTEGLYKVRLLYSKKGTVNIEAQPIKKSEETMKVTLASTSIDKDNPFYYHKTTNRSIYSSFQKTMDFDDVLLWNDKGEITEFTNGNVVVEINGKRWTPPISTGLLAGTYREYLLKNNIIAEKVLTLQDLENCDNIWFINSVRKWREVQLIRP